MAGDDTNTFLVRFRAREDAPVAPDVADRLRDALGALPGIGVVHGTTFDPDHGVVTGEFQVTVNRGVSEASRDGGRFAKEALKNAELPDAQLVELWVGLRDDVG